MGSPSYSLSAWVAVGGLVVCGACVERSGAQTHASRPMPQVTAKPPPAAVVTSPTALPKVDHQVRVPLNQSGQLLKALQSGKPMSKDLLAKLKEQGRAMPTSRPPVAANERGSTGGGLERAVGLQTQKKLQGLFELVSGAPARVVSAGDDSGMWRFEFAIGEANGDRKPHRVVVFASPDGRKFFEGSGKHLDLELDRLRSDKRFAECLLDKGVRVFGDRRGQKTIDQLKAIGSFAGRVYIDCAGDPKACAAQGATELPMVKMGAEALNGFKDRASLERATGCK